MLSGPSGRRDRSHLDTDSRWWRLSLRLAKSALDRSRAVQAELDKGL
ncbi:hypothetical protein XA26_05380 [Mycolicibacterium fortuitum]|uniref:Uncharacterized protein n=1 Tax=Mycolicibacterium fortuitum TaxID=1766 RepID=A0A0N7H7U5_MYCFO|nr:hypothetical protein XA26_05380 [Mycolicibacterium fortuitum]